MNGFNFYLSKEEMGKLIDSFNLIDPVTQRFLDIGLSPVQIAEALDMLSNEFVIISDSKNRTWCCAKPELEFSGALAALRLLQ